jgi:acyl-CoA synthetase (AMP-forming)/AMP-acid ligase II
VTEAEVVDHLRRRLAKHMVPERVVLMDSLPVNSSGKVAKGRLRTMAAAGAS